MSRPLIVTDWLQKNLTLEVTSEEERPPDVRESVQPPDPNLPQGFDDFLGQEGLISVLRGEVRAARAEGLPLPHLLFYGPPGTGKTTLAFVLANEMGGVPVYPSTGAEYATQKEVILAVGQVGTLAEQAKGDVIWLIDETDGMMRIASYPIHTLMTSNQVYWEGQRYGDGRIRVTIIGTTNRPSKVPRAMRSRFAHSLFVDFYSASELTEIARRAAIRGNFPVSQDLAEWIGQNAAGEPRKALHLLRAARTLKAESPDQATTLLAMAGLHRGGLSRPQLEYLTFLKEIGGTAGLNTIGSYLSLDSADVAGDVEGFLIRSKMVKIGRGGRTITERGLEYLTGT